jgi:hypothetical protein
MCIAVFPLCAALLCAALEGLEHETLVFNVLGLSVECTLGLLRYSPSQIAGSCAVELHRDQRSNQRF